MKKSFLLSKNETQNPYYIFGGQYFGPFLYGFTKWLIGSISDSNCQKVFFFSRDGYMMEKCFRIINNNSTIGEYVYFSRKSIRQTFLWKCDTFEKSLAYLSKERFYSVGKILEYYGFDEKERLLVAEEESVALELDIKHDHLFENPTIRYLYEKYKDYIHEKSKKQDELLTIYLRQIGMTGKCAIVDIGWHGSMQYYLDLFLKAHSIDCTLEGFYIGIEPNELLTSKVHGFIYEGKDDKRRKDLLCFFGGYEKLFQGFDGSTYGYQLVDGIVYPVFGPYEYGSDGDKGIRNAIKDLQDGALDFSKKAVDEKNNKSYSELINPLIRFGKKPKLKDTNLFSFFYNNEGTKVYYTAQKGLFRYSLNEFIHALSNSPWKTGFLKSVFKIPFPYYIIYEFMKK